MYERLYKEVERINFRKRASAGYALSLLRGLMNRLVPSLRYIVASKVTPTQLRRTIGGMYASRSTILLPEESRKSHMFTGFTCIRVNRT